jgi:mRNA interferase MazF
MHIKRFLEWIGLKERLHGKICKAPYVNEGEIWWASLGENIGSEINGKSKIFTRPVVVLRKLTHSFYLVAPTTSQERNGSWYVHFRQSNKDMRACLHQIRTIDYRRLYSKLGRLDDVDFAHVKDGFNRLYK